MSKYHVISEFKDADTGQTRVPGDVVDWDDDRALNGLQIGIISDTAPVLPEPADEMPNENWTVKQLRDFATANAIEITTTKKADILFEIELALEADESNEDTTDEEADESNDDE